MIKRYQNSEIAAIWNFQHQVVVWTQIEKLVLGGWFKHGLIPESDWLKLKTGLIVPEITQIAELEKTSHHQVIAFVTALGSSLGPERKWIHYGLTSNDLLDTTQNYLCKASLKVIQQWLTKLLAGLKQRAMVDKYTLMIGRTHGRFAEPITVGLFFARWFAELSRHYKRLTAISQEIGVAKISGATGTYTHLPFEIELNVAKALALQPATISTQLVARDRLIAMYQACANLVTTLESFAIDLRNGQRSEINEFQEHFKTNQQGSSAMPHKVNPIRLERICGLARMVRGFNTTIYHTNLLWNERDLTNSSVERFLVPSLFHLVATMVTDFHAIINDLQINYQAIKANLAKAKPKFTVKNYY